MLITCQTLRNHTVSSVVLMHLPLRMCVYRFSLSSAQRLSDFPCLQALLLPPGGFSGANDARIYAIRF
jgi:hypothetical protein